MTAPPSAPGYPIEVVVFTASNQAEDIALVRNQGLNVDDDIEPAPDNVIQLKLLILTHFLRDRHGDRMESIDVLW